MTPLLQELRGLLEVHHVVERVVQGAQVGVHLLVECPGEEAQLLPGLHRRAGEDDPVHLPLRQGRHRHGHGEVGLAGAGRPDAEDDVVVAHRLDVGLLGEALGADHPAVGGDEHGVEEDVLEPGPPVGAQDAHRVVHVRPVEGVPLLDEGVQLGQDLPGQFHRHRVASQLDRVAPAGQAHVVEEGGQFPQVHLPLPDQHGHVPGIVELQALHRFRVAHPSPGLPTACTSTVRFRLRLSKSQSTTCCHVPRSSRRSRTRNAREGPSRAARTWAYPLPSPQAAS